MLRAKRLERLEADTITAWRTAWEQSAETFERHMHGLHVDTLDVIHRLEVGQPHLSEDEIDQACKKFLRSIDVTQFDAFSVWFKSYELPDLDADRPDLSMWPSDVLTPPDELTGEWDRALPYMVSEDLIERLAAQVYLFILAAARTARGGVGRRHDETKRNTVDACKQVP